MPGAWSTTWQGWQCPPAPENRIQQGCAEPQRSPQALQQLPVTPHFQPQEPSLEDEQGREEGDLSTRASIGFCLGGLLCGTGAHLPLAMRDPTASQSLLHREMLKNLQSPILL